MCHMITITHSSHVIRELQSGARLGIIARAQRTTELIN